MNPSGYLPPGGEPILEHIARKYGAAKAEMFSKPGNPLDVAGAKVGISFNQSRKIFETVDAHRVVEWCKKVAPDRHDALMEVIFKRYFQDAADLTTHEVLLNIVGEVGGLDTDACRKLLNSNEFTEEVKTGVGKAKRKGVSGVPYFIIDAPAGAKDKKPFEFSGAQPADVIQRMLKEISV